LAALLPLGWISFVPEKWNADEKVVMQRWSKWCSDHRKHKANVL
jgi:hypothetical protein